MRGKVRMHEGKLAMDRITPAYAGKRMEDLQEGNTVQDHPRLCGEKLGVYTRSDKTGGSPPPMRGKG